jgi:hypothetical protein
MKMNYTTARVLARLIVTRPSRIKNEVVLTFHVRSELPRRLSDIKFHQYTTVVKKKKQINYSQNQTSMLLSYQASSMSNPSSDHRYTYRQAVKNILSSRKYQNIQSSLESQGIWSRDVYTLFRDWLLENNSVLNNESLSWTDLKEDWLLGRASSVQSSTTHPSFTEMLNLQRNSFQQKLLAPKTTNELPASFFPMAQMVFQELSTQYLSNKNSSVACDVWRKIKECGIVLNESSVASLLSGMLDKHTKLDATLDKNLDEELKSFVDVAMYQDLLYGVTDVTTSVRAMEMLSRGDPLMAEKVLKSFDVSLQ